MRVYETCPWHPTKHEFKNCPLRCQSYCERKPRRARVVSTRWRCRAKVNGRTGRCANGHPARLFVHTLPDQ